MGRLLESAHFQLSLASLLWDLSCNSRSVYMGFISLSLILLQQHLEIARDTSSLLGFAEQSFLFVPQLDNFFVAHAASADEGRTLMEKRAMYFYQCPKV
jgi:hypothetical protein